MAGLCSITNVLSLKCQNSSPYIHFEEMQINGILECVLAEDESHLHLEIKNKSTPRLFHTLYFFAPFTV